MKVKVLKREIWYAGRAYYEGNEIEADDHDHVEINTRVATGELEIIDHGKQQQSSDTVGVMSTDTAWPLVNPDRSE